MAQVRRLGPEDWRAWREIRLRSLADSPDAFGSTLEREEAFTESDWQVRLGLGHAWLVEEEGVAVAMGGAFHPTPDLLHVVAMWVDPAHRGRGHSRAVLDAIVATGRAEGRRVVLDVNAVNEGARAAYLSYGFVPTGATRPLREGSEQVCEEMVLPD